MVTVENVLRVLNHEGYDGISLLKNAINAGVLEKVPYSSGYSSHIYAVTRDSFHSYLYGLKLPERKIDIIMENV